jgi:hypothetical protein
MLAVGPVLTKGRRHAQAEQITPSAHAIMGKAEAARRRARLGPSTPLSAPVYLPSMQNSLPSTLGTLRGLVGEGILSECSKTSSPLKREGTSLLRHAAPSAAPRDGILSE